MIDLFTIFFLGYVVFAISLVYVLLCGESEFHRDGIVGSLNRWLMHGLWVRLKTLGPKLVGNKLWTGIYGIGDWICNKPNPLMQTFYLFLVVGGSSLMMYSGWEFIPGPYLSSIHKVTFPAFLAFVVGFFLFTSKSDPGRITKENWAQFNSIFPVDNVIYGPGFCKTCSICGYDSARHDHHCPWINNCVGLLNLRWFILFLFFTGLIINYVTYLCYYIMYGIITSHGLWFYQDSQGIVHETPYTYIFQYLLFVSVPVVGLFLFTVFIGLVVYGFLVYHLYLICRGTTTNETFKWKDVAMAQKHFAKQRAANRTDQDDVDNPIVKSRKIVNIYNRGIIQNFYEVMFPLSPNTRHSSASSVNNAQSLNEKKKK